jgi:hypothetical protein
MLAVHAHRFYEFFAANAQPELQDRLNLSMPSSAEAAMKIAVQFEREQEKKDQKNKSTEQNKKSDLLNVDKDALRKEIDNRFKQLHDKLYTISKQI